MDSAHVEQTLGGEGSAGEAVALPNVFLDASKQKNLISWVDISQAAAQAIEQSGLAGRSNPMGPAGLHQQGNADLLADRIKIPLVCGGLESWEKAVPLKSGIQGFFWLGRNTPHEQTGRDAVEFFQWAFRV